MTDACLFCRLGSAEVGHWSFVVLETEALLAFPALHPLNPGHLVVVPRAHYGRVEAMPAALRAELLEVGGRLGEAAEALLGYPGSTLLLHQGAPGQPLPHAHLNVVPRRPGDRLDLPRLAEANRAELEELAERLRAALQNRERDAGEGGAPAAATPGGEESP